MNATIDTPHPHDIEIRIPDRIDSSELRRLSAIDSKTAALCISAEWAMIAAAVCVASLIPNVFVIAAAVIFIGARQQALTVIAHDASHFRLFPNRAANDLIGNLLLAWPMFISVEGFRHFHSRHHRHLNTGKDGNRELWHTHGPEGELSEEWQLPKTAAGLLWLLVRRGAFYTGLFWIVRGLLGGFLIGTPRWAAMLRAVCYLGAAASITATGAWSGFLMLWVLPYCTWHLMIQYMRLICEHSAVRSADPRYAETRTTIPGFFGRLLVLPRNIGYHIEHHWYPSVPFYRLPDLHEALMANPNYRVHANVHRSLASSLRECVTRR